MTGMISTLLSLPEARGIDLDSPEAVPIHRRIILRKPFLRRLYVDQYKLFSKETALVRDLPGETLELGSGGGFLKDVLPDVITSDVEAYPGVDRVVWADHLPFSRGSLKAIFLLNVLHHLPQPELFFQEATRCLVPGGRVVMIEPFNSVMGRFLYKHFHHEPFDDTVREWSVHGQGRLTASNQALPWIIFTRDRKIFESRFPQLRIVQITPHTLFGYVLSGGLSWKSLAPGIAYPLARSIDRLLSRWPWLFPIFQTIILERI
jgi:SAM-dependent methyltransferase